MNLLPPYEAYSYKHLVTSRENIAKVLKEHLPSHVLKHLQIELLQIDKEIKRRDNNV